MFEKSQAVFLNFENLVEVATPHPFTQVRLDLHMNLSASDNFQMGPFQDGSTFEKCTWVRVDWRTPLPYIFQFTPPPPPYWSLVLSSCTLTYIYQGKPAIKIHNHMIPDDKPITQSQKDLSRILSGSIVPASMEREI